MKLNNMNRYHNSLCLGYFWQLMIFISVFSILPIYSCGQNSDTPPAYLYNIFNSEEAQKVYSQSLKYSKNGNSRSLITLRHFLNANNTLLENEFDEDIIDYQRKLIDGVIESSEVSKRIKNNKSKYKDDYRGWVSKTVSRHPDEEIVLYESYSFFHIAQFLYLLEQKEWTEVSDENKRWWNETLGFIEQNVWRKWYDRGKIQYKERAYFNFLRNRTHMGSHWAGIAMYLKEISNNSNIKKQSKEVQEQYDLLLKRNLKPNTRHASAYSWNSTYDNIEKTMAKAEKSILIQDTPHANHVVSYIIAAYEKGGEEWSLDDITKLCETVKNVIYDKKSNKFRDKIDNSANIMTAAKANSVADGWVKLSKYDETVKEIFKDFEMNENIYDALYNKLEFKVNLYGKDL